MADRFFEVHFSPGGEVVFRVRPKTLRQMVPTATQEHLRNASRETLLALRSFLDQCLEMQGAGPAPEPDSPARGRRRRIEVREEKPEGA
ncbi:MAG: hypothetical protein HY686_05005 [Chloroflexi bacterium]|nr:hypothetical protein [Chloroflexota bacterium]